MEIVFLIIEAIVLFVMLSVMRGTTFDGKILVFILILGVLIMKNILILKNKRKNARQINPEPKRRSPTQMETDPAPEVSSTILKEDIPVKEKSPDILRDYMIRDTESYIIPKVEGDKIPQLQRIADSFFADRKDILAVPSGNLSADRLQAILGIYEYLKASGQGKHGGSFASASTHASKDHIECFEWKYQHEGICYDGGCYSDDSYEEINILHIDIITEDDCKDKLDKPKQSFWRDSSWKYKGKLPNDDAFVFCASNWEFYMHHPFGTVINLCFRWK